ncbi:hemin-degrading factor [Bartonella apis]|uniref:hemin-degrading factor n=1 Tax=Bartonella apis TaxID=1686310 RepID=UPI00096373E8|nr:ChuX/HutX family heme-like substrate-binding protein [Bartonella apis]OLY47899.1 putative hemin transport protein [Bartonella apis]
MTLESGTILSLREQDKDLRDREFVKSIGISEAELVEAFIPTGKAQRLKIDVPLLLKNAHKLGEVMALTRNEYAVSEKKGHFQNVFPGSDVSMTLGQIDLRIFQNNWKFAFVRTMPVRDRIVDSLQFFDAYGEAVFKLYPEPTTNLDEWNKLVALLKVDATKEKLRVLRATPYDNSPIHNADIEEFRNRWRQMTDVHQLHDILKELKIGRHDAVKLVGSEFANEVRGDSVEILLQSAAEREVPIMCFVGNKGCIQIFTGKIEKLKKIDGWFNILDEKFHLHLLTSGISRIWNVRKPTSDGYVSSLEVFDQNGEMIIQFFGKRSACEQEREDWRSLLSELPPAPEMAVA